MVRDNPVFEFIPKAWIAIKNYLSNKEQSYSRMIHFARLSILFNALIGLGKIIMGLYNRSFIFTVSGFYNIGLSLAKAVAVKGYSESKGKQIWPFNIQADNSISIKNKKKEYRYYQLVGLIVLLASVAYTIGSIGVLIGSRSIAHYSTIMVVEIGLITAVEIIISLLGVLARRREKEPILEAIKLTSFVSSLIGLVLVQTAIFGHLGRQPIIYFDFVGIFLGAVSFFVSVYMIVSARRKMIKPPE